MNSVGEALENHLENGGTVICYDCPNEISKGDPYLIIDGKMYCCQECVDESRSE